MQKKYLLLNLLLIAGIVFSLTASSWNDQPVKDEIEVVEASNPVPDLKPGEPARSTLRTEAPVPPENKNDVSQRRGGHNRHGRSGK